MDSQLSIYIEFCNSDV